MTVWEAIGDQVTFDFIFKAYSFYNTFRFLKAVNMKKNLLFHSLHMCLLNIRLDWMMYQPLFKFLLFIRKKTQWNGMSPHHRMWMMTIEKD